MYGELRGRGLAHNLAVLNLEDAMGDVGHAGVMRHDHDRLLEFLVEATKQVEDFLTGLRVEFPGRLVCQEERRIVREGDPDGDPLLFPTAELVGTMARALRHAHELEELPAPLRTNRGPFPRQSQWKLYVLLRGERRDEVEELKDETDAGQAILDEVSISEIDEVGTIYLDSACGGPVDPAEEIQQGRLPASRGPLDRDQLAVRDLHVEAAKRDHFGLPGSIHLNQILRSNLRHITHRVGSRRARFPCGRGGTSP